MIDDVRADEVREHDRRRPDSPTLRRARASTPTSGVLPPWERPAPAVPTTSD